MIAQKSLPWYALEKAEKGAYSAFLGLLINFEDHYYDAIAIGDCCLFHIRNEIVISTFPILHSSEFGNKPYLISSKPVMNTGLESKILLSEMDLMVGDILFLMSDALAHWFMTSNELSQQPWQILKGFKNKQRLDNYKLTAWLDDLRIKKSIKNDDVVLSLIEFY